ncbi:MAG: carbohydrate ABC transporter permease [Chloroflexota bacterium]
MQVADRATDAVNRSQAVSGRHLTDRFGSAVIYVALTVFTAIAIVPVINVIARSFSPEAFIRAGEVFFWPVGFTLSAYLDIIQSDQFLTGLRNSVIVTVIATPLQMFLTTCAAYALSRPRLPGRSVLMYVVVIVMVFPPGLIPFYLTVRYLGLIDSYFALILPYAINSFNLILMRSFFDTLPVELEEAAVMDGANQWQIMTRIYLPLSKPALATITLFYFVQNWNMYLPAVFFITNGDLEPLQPVLRDIIFSSQLAASGALPGDFNRLAGTEGIKAAAVVLTALPIFAVYPFLQKYFTKGLTLGAIKG